ncbi:MAG: SdrD B-like domain-containing protein [Patescibacteria group bacterium]
MRRLRCQAQRGNAILFSLLIMGSALTASIGMATLVTSEISNVSLIPPSERAYYKAESYVEQGLWEKKQDPKFHADDKDGLLADYPDFLCSGNCFSSDPRNQAGSLIRYQSTTSIPEEKLILKQDKVVQLDIDTSEVTGATGRFDLRSIKNEDGLRGVEVTVIAYPKEAPFTEITGSAGDPVGTPVFVETRLFRPTDGRLWINLGPPETNKLGEPFPPLSDSVYRLRLKALGADTEVDPLATEGLSTPLLLLTPDFRITSVAEDGRARRGIEVLVPATEQIASIFDFVIFSDLTLAKTDAKQQRIKSLKVKVYEDANRNCVRDAGDGGLQGVSVAVGSAYSESTDADGIASFPDVQPGTYPVSPSTATGSEVCSPQTRNVTFADDSTTELKELTFLVKPPERVPLYRFYNYVRVDHFYTTRPCTSGSASTGCTAEGGYVPGRAYFGGGGWHYEHVTGYVYREQVAGTDPFYQAWHDGNRDSDHFYTMNKGEWDYWTAPGRFYSSGSLSNDSRGLWVARRGIAGYMRPLNAGCRNGTVPWYRKFYLDGSGTRDHFYTASLAERNAVTWYRDEGITGCLWTTRN